MAVLFWAWAIATPGQAGLGPHQVLLVYDAEHPQSIEVANRYATLRQIPTAHFCPIILGDLENKTISMAAFMENWVPSLEGCLEGLSPQDVWAFALSSHLPHRVVLANETHRVSLVSLLQTFFLSHEGERFMPSAHLMEDNVQLPTVRNPLFVGTENPVPDFAWRSLGDENYNATSTLVRSLLLPGNADFVANTESFSGQMSVAFHLEGMRHVDSLSLLENALAGETAEPVSAKWVAMRGVSEARQVRDPEANFLADVLTAKGRASEFISTHDGALLPDNLVGFFTGAELLHDVLPQLNFHPAAMVDNVTSYGAVPANWQCSDEGCPENEIQTAIGHFIALGASQVHGTVDEPLNNSFPNMGAYFLYDAGYTAAESWFYNQPYLFWQNAYWGDGLAAPFAQRPTVTYAPKGASLLVTAEHGAGITWLAAFQDGQLVQETTQSTLELQINELGAGEVLLVAQADVFESRHEGLKVSAQINASGPMGWLQITEQDWIFSASQTEPKTPGCDCRSSNAASAPLTLLYLFVLCRSRRSRL
ncbi:MAG: hypothetical protein CMH56_02365 [Myxococcales bacterium]|nr:hypothetical protein [Myxococcales bacterium]